MSWLYSIPFLFPRYLSFSYLNFYREIRSTTISSIPAYFSNFKKLYMLSFGGLALTSDLDLNFLCPSAKSLGQLYFPFRYYPTF